MFALGFTGNVPFAPRAGLVPQAGVVLYWDRNNHVAISLGRRWIQTQQGGWHPEDLVMSHWHHNNGSFSVMKLDQVTIHAGTAFRFRPCP